MSYNPGQAYVDIFEKLDNKFKGIIQSILKDLDNTFRLGISSAFMSIDTAPKPTNSDENLENNQTFMT
ncbi:hypothetical protein AYI69_g5878 [Smittium culicis]|uniref:Uncharacterized protein n=1 Tax=Smittium culicis TaxID=133412 RepID=A0A1R1Y357_9FUNG|nr:hypothetical protein AYI69_g5878 [Smittium culicis]